LISVKATKHFPYLLFLPKTRKDLAVVPTFWDLNLAVILTFWDLKSSSLDKKLESFGLSFFVGDAKLQG